jgi:hypothetical protein
MDALPRYFPFSWECGATETEVAEARSKVETLSRDPRNRRLVVWHQEVVDRYERQKAGPVDSFTMELHVIRLGDITGRVHPGQRAAPRESSKPRAPRRRTAPPHR